MDITVKELESLDPENYIRYDIRSNSEKLYGVMSGAVESNSNDLIATPPTDKSKKIVSKYITNGNLQELSYILVHNLYSSPV